MSNQTGPSVGRAAAQAAAQSYNAFSHASHERKEPTQDDINEWALQWQDFLLYQNLADQLLCGLDLIDTLNKKGDLGDESAALMVYLGHIYQFMDSQATRRVLSLDQDIRGDEYAMQITMKGRLARSRFTTDRYNAVRHNLSNRQDQDTSAASVKMAFFLKSMDGEILTMRDHALSLYHQGQALLGNVIKMRVAHREKREETGVASARIDAMKKNDDDYLRMKSTCADHAQKLFFADWACEDNGLDKSYDPPSFNWKILGGPLY